MMLRSLTLTLFTLLQLNGSYGFVGGVLPGVTSTHGLSWATSKWYACGRRAGSAGEVEEGKRSETMTFPGVSRLSMGLETDAVDRREAIRLLGVGVASWVAATGTHPGRSSSRTANAAVAPATIASPPAKPSSKPLCDDAVSHLRNPATQSDMWLVGTAHISNASAQLVGDVIRMTGPQVVMVELDADRIDRFVLDKLRGDIIGLEDAAPAERRTISLGERLTDFFAAGVGQLISGMYKTLGEEGYSVGQEFTTAIVEARRCGAKILLGDRPVKETLRRISRAIAKTDMQELADRAETEMKDLGIFESPGSMDLMSIGEGTERMKNRSTLTKLTSMYKEVAPELYAALISERDQVMANNLMALDPKQTVVAVVGLGHVDGMEGFLSEKGWRRQRC